MNRVIREISCISRELVFANQWNLNISREFIFVNSSKRKKEENLSQTRTEFFLPFLQIS